MAAVGQQSAHEERFVRWQLRVRAAIILAGSIAGWVAVGATIFRV